MIPKIANIRFHKWYYHPSLLHHFTTILLHGKPHGSNSSYKREKSNKFSGICTTQWDGVVYYVKTGAMSNVSEKSIFKTQVLENIN